MKTKTTGNITGTIKKATLHISEKCTTCSKSSTCKFMNSAKAYAENMKQSWENENVDITTIHHKDHNMVISKFLASKLLIVTCWLEITLTNGQTIIYIDPEYIETDEDGKMDPNYQALLYH